MPTSSYRYKSTLSERSFIPHPLFKMIDELSALERIRERFQKISKAVSLGIGDDAAAVRIHPKKLLLATVDSQVEDIHFIKNLISAKDLGRKSIAVSVSDIGAMGGVPKFFLT
ncbi:MAG: AIR synthase related protein, partial [Thermodesulfobacteriota bacterium]